MALPLTVRVNAPISFPGQVLGSGPVTIAKLNGVYTLGLSVAGLVDQLPPAGNLATDFVPVFDAVQNTWFKTSLAELLGDLQVAATSLLGNSTGVAAAAQSIALGAALVFSGASLRTVAMTGDVTTAANSFATTIAANVVNFSKIQQVGAVSLIGNSTGVVANLQGILLGATLAFSGATLQTAAHTGDVTTAANSFATTVAKIAGTTVSGTTGTVNVVFSTSPTLTTPLLGTPTSGVLTNCTGLPVSSGISGLAANVATFLATPTSANLAAALTDETGTGGAVFNNTPTLITPVLGAATGTSLLLGGGTLGTVGEQLTANGNAAAHVAMRISNAHASGFSTLWFGTANEGFIRYGSSVGNKLTVVASTAGVPVTLATQGVDRLSATDNRISATVPYAFPSYTVAGLPAGATGDVAWASNCRVFNGAGVQEGAAAGTGGLVTYNGTAWKIAGTNVTAVA